MVGKFGAIFFVDAVIDYETEQMADFYIVVTDDAGFFAHEIPARVEIGPANEFSPTFYPSTIADVTVDENSPVRNNLYYNY